MDTDKNAKFHTGVMHPNNQTILIKVLGQFDLIDGNPDETARTWSLLSQIRPKIAPELYAHFQDSDKKCYFIMEKVEGTLLCDVVPSLNIDERWIVIGKLLETIFLLHNNRFVHGCIFNEYILVTKDQNIILLFFDNLELKENRQEYNVDVDEVRNLIHYVATNECPWFFEMTTQDVLDHKFDEYIRFTNGNVDLTSDDSLKVRSKYAEHGWNGERTNKLVKMCYKLTVHDMLEIYNS